MPAAHRPVCLIIMDGLAYGEGSQTRRADTPDRSDAIALEQAPVPEGLPDRSDAVAAARTPVLEGLPDRSDAVAAAWTPVLDGLWSSALHTTLTASGGEVGLPAGQMGNSEVGHLNIGAGRVVYQDLTRIDHAIEDGSFFENEVLLDAMRRARDTGATVHLMGLVSDGGVHSSNRHLHALLELARRVGLDDIVIHAFLDGRDTPPTSGIEYLAQLEEGIGKVGIGRIASIMGRYWAMDRDTRWDRVQRAYDALTRGQGAGAASAMDAIARSYEAETTDEFVEPTLMEGSYQPIEDGDSVIFFNFRPDRAREITHALTDECFSGFERKATPRVHFVGFTPYDDTLDIAIAYPKQRIDEVLGEVVSAQGLRQYRIAETEKYAHVTFFLNGGLEDPYPGEQRVLIASPSVATYDLQPQMSAVEITDTVVAAIQAGEAELYIVNFANGDMVGHTGVFEATKKAVETVDAQVGRIVAAMDQSGGVTLITADHGNAEQMLDSSGDSPFTAHTGNAVPLIVVGSHAQAIEAGSLRDIAPTITGLLGIEASPLWTGSDLLVY